MRIIKNQQQIHSLAKLFWDMGKVVATALIVYPFATGNSNISYAVVGIIVACMLWSAGLYIEGKEA